ncbi:hypothetical protein [Methylocystis sp.]|uniref:hypothetical protein n=1 Tax=Methylocystis sp. TaxID=1911079 RepID=UPI003DA65C7F
MKTALKQTASREPLSGMQGRSVPSIVAKVFGKATYEAPRVIPLDTERLRRSDPKGVTKVPPVTMMGNF